MENIELNELEEEIVNKVKEICNTYIHYLKDNYLVRIIKDDDEHKSLYIIIRNIKNKIAVDENGVKYGPPPKERNHE